MTNFDEEIAAAATTADDLRTNQLPPLADAYIDACVAWVPTAWDEVVRNAVRAHPEVGQENPQALSTLKRELGELIADAPARVREALGSWLVHDRLDDEALIGLVKANGWTAPMVTLPRTLSRKSDEGYRLLVGAIGPAMNRAGLLTPDSPVSAEGRYRIHMGVPPAVTSALLEYEGAVSDLAISLYTAARLRREKTSAEAESLWDEA